MQKNGPYTGMKSVWFATVLSVCVSLGSGFAHAAQQSISNEKELRVALKTAGTADDHRRIAAYYEMKAEELEKKEKDELNQADFFAKYPNMTGKAYPNLYQHHKDLADSYRRAKVSALQKAKEHREAADKIMTVSH